jgi:hypothetical protein
MSGIRLGTITTTKGVEVSQSFYKGKYTSIRMVTVKVNNNDVRCKPTRRKTDILESSTNLLLAAGLEVSVVINCLPNIPESSSGTIFYNTSTNNLLSYDGDTWFNIKLFPQKEPPIKASLESTQGTLFYDKELSKLFFYDGNEWHKIQLTSDEKLMSDEKQEE